MGQILGKRRRLDACLKRIGPPSLQSSDTIRTSSSSYQRTLGGAIDRGVLLQSPFGNCVPPGVVVREEVLRCGKHRLTSSVLQRQGAEPALPEQDTLLYDFIEQYFGRVHLYLSEQ